MLEEGGHIWLEEGRERLEAWMVRPCVESCRLEVTAPQQRVHTVTQWGARKKATRPHMGPKGGRQAEAEEKARDRCPKWRKKTVLTCSRASLSLHVLPTVCAPVYMDAPSCFQTAVLLLRTRSKLP